MLDLGIKVFKKFSLPETICGERVIIERRAHKHDEELFNLINNSREFLAITGMNKNHLNMFF